jgi:hypothetical protein
VHNTLLSVYFFHFFKIDEGQLKRHYYLVAGYYANGIQWLVFIPPGIKQNKSLNYIRLLYLSARYDSENKQLLFPRTKFFVAELHYIFCEVRTEYLYTI